MSADDGQGRALELAQIDADVARLAFKREILGMAACLSYQDGTGYYVDSDEPGPSHVMRPVYAGSGCYGLGRCTTTDLAFTVLGHRVECLAAVDEYSGRIGAAWLVVGKMQERLYWHAVEIHSDSMPDGRQGWCCGFGVVEACAGAFAETLPLAICKAALMALAALAHDAGRAGGE